MPSFCLCFTLLSSRQRSFQAAGSPLLEEDVIPDDPLKCEFKVSLIPLCALLALLSLRHVLLTIIRSLRFFFVLSFPAVVKDSLLCFSLLLGNFISPLPQRSFQAAGSSLLDEDAIQDDHD